jgi:UPF0755 protein
VSPANIDDSSGIPSEGGARPLTRKELRAREKSLHSESNSVVPEQAYETGPDFLPTVDVPVPAHEPVRVADPAPVFVPAPARAADPAPEPLPAPAPAIPIVPDTPPSIQQVEPAHQVTAQHDVIPLDNVDQHRPLPEEPLQNDFHFHDAPHDEASPSDVHGFHHLDAHHEDTQHLDAHHLDAHHLDDHHLDDQHLDDQHHDDLHVVLPHPDDQHLHEGHQLGTHQLGAHPADAHHHDAGLLSGASAVAVVPRSSKKVRRRRRLLVLMLTLVVFVTAVAVGAQFLKPLLGTDKASDYPGPGSGEVQVSVQPGEGPRAVATALENQKVVANADTFLHALTASGGTLSPGDYTFKMEMTNSDAVNVLLGKDKSKVIYFALSAGLRIGESLQAISEGSGVPLGQLQELSNDPVQFGVPATAKNLEGFLAPGEYRFPLGTPAKEILQSLVKVTLDELVSQGMTDPAKQYEALIVASIVQAEGGQAEYGDVAGAIYNRLKPNDQTGGFLQVDSAVTYGLGTRSFNFTEAEREDKANPYNTYANPGLPPGPIGSPGKTAIDAAAKPKTNDYLYWVTINLDTKETKFSKTLAEHNMYVDQYNAWCQAHVGRCT